ncbi:hypothetical protein APSETT444_007003 [Aspergillus pseudonomiae]
MMSITRYKDPIPDGALIVTTLDGAAFVQKTFPHAIFYPENNGHYAKDPDGTVIAVASDALCEEIDRRNAELEAKIAAGEKLTDEDRDYAPAYGAVGRNLVRCAEGENQLEAF